MQKCLENGNVPISMTKRRTILMQNRDKEKGKAASNYRPITCLPLVWKLLAGVNCGRRLWIFGYKFVIILRTKKMREKI